MDWIERTRVPTVDVASFVSVPLSFNRVFHVKRNAPEIQWRKKAPVETGAFGLNRKESYSSRPVGITL